MNLEYREPEIILSAPGKCNWCGRKLTIGGRYYCSRVCFKEYSKWWTKAHRRYKRDILLRDEFKCQICRIVPLTVNQHWLVIPDLHELDIDHIQPQSRGGKRDGDNLQVLCSHCNRSKNKRTVEEYQHRVKEIVQEITETDAWLASITRYGKITV